MYACIAELRFYDCQLFEWTEDQEIHISPTCHGFGSTMSVGNYNEIKYIHK